MYHTGFGTGEAGAAGFAGSWNFWGMQHQSRNQGCLVVEVQRQTVASRALGIMPCYMPRAVLMAKCSPCLRRVVWVQSGVLDRG